MRGWLVRNRWIVVCAALAAVGLFGALAWAQGVGNVEAASGQVIFYEHTNWGGNSMSFDFDKDIPDLTKWKFLNSSTTWNDKISSIKVGANAQVILYQHTNYKGSSITLKGTGSGGAGDFPDLPKIGWNDKVSSFKVRMGDVN